MLLFICPAVIILFGSAVLHMLSFGILLLYLWLLGAVMCSECRKSHPKKKPLIFVIAGGKCKVISGLRLPNTHSKKNMNEKVYSHNVCMQCMDVTPYFVKSKL